MNNHETPHVVVLGAGVCGLYAARVLVDRGVRVTLIERLDRVGGLATGYEINGNHYDIGVHHLHAFDREIFEDLMEILGDRLHPVELVSHIKHGKGYSKYPLEFADLLLGIPPGTLLRCLSGLLLQQVRNKVRPDEAHNAEEALVQLYGRPLYDYFFREFTHRYWHTHPTQLSATFVKRKMPRLSAVDVLKKWLSKLGFDGKEDLSVESAVRKETLWFSREGASGMPRGIAHFLRERGCRIVLGAEVTGIDTEGNRVRAVTYRQDDREHNLACDACLSTIPITTLVRGMRPRPGSRVLEAVEALRYKPIAVYGFLVRRENVLGEALYTYFRNSIFHRLSEPKNSGVIIRPEDHTTILAEITCEVGDPAWNGDPSVVERIVADMEREGLLEADEVVEVHQLQTEYGYPMYELGFEPHLDTLKALVGRFPNLRSVGRQGGFCYPTMHVSMRMGAEAAEELVAEEALSPRSEDRRSAAPDRVRASASRPGS